jgi:hypothetical protein
MMKVAAFTVRGTVAQSARWKQAAEAEGHSSVGAWLARAADGYIRAATLTGRPRPLAWHKAAFRAVLESGPAMVRGQISPPFASYRGNRADHWRGAHSHVLVILSTGRILATLPTARDCKALASELARLWVRWDGSEPDESQKAQLLLAGR